MSTATRSGCAVFVDQGPAPGWLNMAVDCALLDRAAETRHTTFRLYSWAPHCLSFGRHEPAARRYDRARIERSGLAAVRRPTGGRAVWHARELTYAVTAPLRSFGTMAQAYAAIHELLVRALQALGAPASLAPHHPRAGDGLDGGGACFASPVGGEVMVRGHKVIGSAQLRRGEVFLQHGSILMEDDQDMIASLLRRPSVPTAKPSPASGAPLSRLLQRRVEPAALVDAIVSEVEQDHGNVSLRPPSNGLRSAATRYTERFQDPAWTWRR